MSLVINGYTIKPHADLSVCDLSGCDLSGCDLRGCDLSGADLRFASLSGCDLSGANLRGCDLSGCDLRGCDLSGASLRFASLRGAMIYGHSSALCLGTDPRGYVFLAVRHEGGWMIAAGCRWFTLAQAREHWMVKNNRDALARLAIIPEESP